MRGTGQREREGERDGWLDKGNREGHGYRRKGTGRGRERERWVRAGREVTYADQVRVIFNKLHIRHVPTSRGSLTMDGVAPSDSCPHHLEHVPCLSEVPHWKVFVGCSPWHGRRRGLCSVL